MKTVLIIVALCIGAVVSTGLSVIELDGEIKQIEFDSNSNVYVVTNSNLISNSSSKFYKLDSTRNITLEISLQNIGDIFVTKADNVYIFDKLDSYPIESLYLLKPNAEEIIKIYDMRVDLPAHFKDEKDNIFFNTHFGVALLTHDETVPTAVVNLENFNIFDKSTCAVDYSGNIYLGGRHLRLEGLSFLATISDYQIENTAPSAEIFDTPNPNLQVLSYVGADFKKNVHVGFSGDQARIYRSYSYGFSDVELAQYQHDYTSFHPTENRFYFFSTNLFNGECHLNFLYQEDIFSQLKFTQIAQNLPYNVCTQSQIVSDSNGNLFFKNVTQVLYVKNNETEIKEISFSGEAGLEVSSIAVDQNDDLWIVKGSVNVVRKDSTVAEVLSSIFTLESSSVLKINERTNEVFIGDANGLFIYTI